MALKEYIKIVPLTEQGKKSKSTMITVVLPTFNIFLTTILPFVCGVYFAEKRNILFLIPILFFVFFRVIISEDDNV
jgi:hypothetical protein